MIKSIRGFLLINLLLSVTLITSLAITTNLLSEHKDFKTHLDAQLVLMAYTIQAFMHKHSAHDLHNIQKKIQSIPKLTEYLHPTEEHRAHFEHLLQSIQFQAYENGRLLLESVPNEGIALPETTAGFHNVSVGNLPLRTFTSYNARKTIRVTVVQRHDFRRALESKIIGHSIMIMLVIYPFLSLLIWLIVSRGLQDIKELQKALQIREHRHLAPINIDSAPKEIQPLINELNKLLQRLKEAFEREKNFASDAAHELRTPLAALSAQAQVALHAQDPKERQKALQNLLIGVKRSTHVIQQLLTLSRMMPESTTQAFVSANLVKIVREVIADLTPEALAKKTIIQTNLPNSALSIPGNIVALSTLIRNLIDNAIRYSPSQSIVIVSLSTQNNQTILSVEDNGPGIPAALHERVFQRFFRVLGNKSSGSGLGLNIVQQIVALHNARITLGTPRHSVHGLGINIIFPH